MKLPKTSVQNKYILHEDLDKIKGKNKLSERRAEKEGNKIPDGVTDKKGSRRQTVDGEKRAAYEDD